MDAKRIAGIRERAEHSNSWWRDIPRSQLIALCDLAAEAVAMKEAARDVLPMNATVDLNMRTTEILSNPKHERRG